MQALLEDEICYGAVGGFDGICPRDVAGEVRRLAF